MRGGLKLVCALEKYCIAGILACVYGVDV
jgi:hypothetical protein